MITQSILTGSRLGKTIKFEVMCDTVYANSKTALIFQKVVKGYLPLRLKLVLNNHTCSAACGFSRSITVVASVVF